MGKPDKTGFVARPRIVGLFVISNGNSLLIRLILPKLLKNGYRPRVEMANGGAGFGGIHGSKPERPAQVKTPFILERANPSQGGDAKLWAFGHRRPPSCRRDGQAKSPSVPEPASCQSTGWPSSLTWGPDRPVTPRLALLTFRLSTSAIHSRKIALNRHRFFCPWRNGHG
jgi:hypothetical protein